MLLNGLVVNPALSHSQSTEEVQIPNSWAFPCQIQVWLLSLLKAFSLEEIEFISIAYEPIWAIGTGKTASPEQASEMHDFIREELIVLFGSEASDNTTILYGGSCSPKNAEALFRCDNIDGGLIGGAALDGDSFRSIIEVL